MKEEPAEEDISRDNRSKQKTNSAYTMRDGSKLETVEDLKVELQKKELRSRISKMDEKAFKQKIFTAISAVGSFLVVTYLFSNYLTAAGKSPDLSAALSLVAGFFSAFLIMAISGIIKEFSIKSGIIEVRSILEQKIEKVQINVEESKKEVEGKISILDNRIANMNMNQNIQQLASRVNTGVSTAVTINNNPLSDEQTRKINVEAEKQVINLDDRDIEDVFKNAPIKSVISQQAT